jgi:hypothetical protein
VAALPFDTLDYVRKLEAAGVPPAEAEVHARALNDALAGSVASKADISNLDVKIDVGISNLELKIDVGISNLDVKIDAVESRLKSGISNLELKIDALESRLSSRIDVVKNELELHFGGKLETLKWMFGVLVAMNAAVIVQLLLKH